jgi:hypothetical protein
MQKALFTDADGTQQPFSLIFGSEPPTVGCNSSLEVVGTDLAQLVVGSTKPDGGLDADLGADLR